MLHASPAETRSLQAQRRIAQAGACSQISLPPQPPPPVTLAVALTSLVLPELAQALGVSEASRAALGRRERR